VAVGVQDPDEAGCTCDIQARLPREGTETDKRVSPCGEVSLHSLVLAAFCGVPFTSIDYNIKIGGFMDPWD